MIVSENMSIDSITKDRINEYSIVLGVMQQKIFRLRLNNNGRWFWENLLTTESLPSLYVSRPEAIDDFAGDVEVFKNEHSAYTFLRCFLMA
jgi:hypothetical protein